MTLLWGEMGLLCALNLELNSQICGVAFFQEIMLHAVFFLLHFRSFERASREFGRHLRSFAYTQNVVCLYAKHLAPIRKIQSH